MILKNINHPFSYQTEKIATMFFPLEKIKDGSGSEISVEIKKENNVYTVFADVYGKKLKKSVKCVKDDDEQTAVSVLLYSVLSEITGFKPPWGILYGVRPVKLMRSKCEKLGEDAAAQYFRGSLVSEEKIRLALEVMHNEDKIISLSGPDSFSLYISIPFCPTRCDYCSFVSHSIEHAKELERPYVDLLKKELEIKGKAAKDLNLKLESIYIGGGTPTTLDENELNEILGAVEDNFDVAKALEFTVEAGRPDTVTAEKLKVLKNHGVTRISINPQTFNDSVRALAGRHHTTKQTLDAFYLARQEGFGNINMDFIAGLEGESVESFENGIKKAVELGAESVTIHNLALKSGANLVTQKKFYDLEKRILPSKMTSLSSKILRDASYFPYYMYRQSKSFGNLENTGWCKNGYECLYNVFMMDETHTVICAGAGAVTMLKDRKTGHIERIYNFKYPYEYISKFDELILRTQGIYKFYKA